MLAFYYPFTGQGHSAYDFTWSGMVLSMAKGDAQGETETGHGFGLS